MSSVNFRGQDILPEKYVCKIKRMPELYMILARKIIKISVPPAPPLLLRLWLILKAAM